MSSNLLTDNSLTDIIILQFAFKMIYCTFNLLKGLSKMRAFQFNNKSY